LEKSNTTANLHAGEVASISGYGKTSDTSGVSPVLNEVDGVPIITNAVCAQTFGNLVVNAGVVIYIIYSFLKLNLIKCEYLLLFLSMKMP
jgi:hypothetical protein